MNANANGAPTAPPTRAEAFRTFLRIGLLSFGGPAAQIALMHRTLVDEKRWLDERTFLNALNFCMLLPGPEAMQLATYAGWRLHGVAGGLVAGGLFVAPGAAVILALSLVYALVGNVPVVEALFLGVQAAVLVIVVEALLRVARRALKNRSHWIIAALAFVALFLFDAPYPAVIIAAAGWGALAARGAVPGAVADPAARVLVHPGQTLRIVAAGLVLWFLPVAIAAVAGAPLLVEIGLFFSKLAVVTFGGAYAVLAYMAQEVVQDRGWLSAAEMLDGLGLAETTPGPLILVTEFVGFMAGFREGGVTLGVLAALMTLWVTFVPCFLWIFAGAPYLAWISAQPRLAGALAAITAGVVGVILNLSVWFALHVLFGQVTQTRAGPLVLWLPDLATFDPRVAIIAALAGMALLRLHWGLPVVLAISAVLGLVAGLALP
jgi:chromate transporter